jgi:hypothetical protein
VSCGHEKRPRPDGNGLASGIGADSDLHGTILMVAQEPR